MSEAAILNLVRLEATQRGCRLWRNNVGATYTKDGSFIRYGLANETKQMNTVIKSADLIGIRPILITPAHVGMVLGQFLSREVKTEGWRYTATDREKAQMAWAHLIISLGGDAGFTTGASSI
jgi:hypothetical protein